MPLCATAPIGDRSGRDMQLPPAAAPVIRVRNVLVSVVCGDVLRIDFQGNPQRRWDARRAGLIGHEERRRQVEPESYKYPSLLAVWRVTSASRADWACTFPSFNALRRKRSASASIPDALAIAVPKNRASW